MRKGSFPTPNQIKGHLSPQTPPTRIRQKSQLARHRQRSPVLPRRTVKRHASRRPHRQRPRRRHLRAKPPPPERLRCLQPCLRRSLRPPRTETDAHRVAVHHHRHDRRTFRYLRDRPPGKVARKQWQRIHVRRGIRLFDCLGKSECRPRVYFTAGQRPVLLRMHRNPAEVRHRRLRACKTFKFFRDSLRHVSPYSPGAVRPAANQHKPRPWLWVRLTCPEDSAGAIQQEQSVKVEVGCAHRTTRAPSPLS